MVATRHRSNNASKNSDERLLAFVTKTLTEEEPRVKWESAKIIRNISKLFPNGLSYAITNLLTNTEHSGTVVRWATAYALAEIVKIKNRKQ